MAFTKPQQSSNLSDTELLELLNKEGLQETTGKFKNNMTLFLEKFSISPGTVPIKPKALFALYQSWCDDSLKYNNFAKLLYLFLPRKNNTCLINKAPIEILEFILSEQKEDSRPRARSLVAKKRMDAFFGAYSIRPGKLWLENYLLYHLYDAWNFDNKYRTQLNDKDFTKILSLYFEHKRGPRGYLLVALHEDVLQKLPLEVIKDIRNARKQGIFHGKKKKNKKV